MWVRTMCPQSPCQVEPPKPGRGSLEANMVPSSYSSFSDAASQAAGALIGLLFVVIALDR
jgi:hypothetical protein